MRWDEPGQDGNVAALSLRLMCGGLFICEVLNAHR